MMCGHSPCVPMHPGCTHSPEHRKACYDRDVEAERILALPKVDRAAEINRWPEPAKLRAVIVAKYERRKSA